MPDALAVVYGEAAFESVPRPLVKLERFGKIKKAEVELSPLTILVGRNNTGKSYMASLLWAIRSSEYGISPFPASQRISAPDWFRDYVETAGLDTPPLEVSAAKLMPYLTECLSNRKEKIVSDLLSLEDASCGKLDLEFSGRIWLSRHRTGPVWANEAEWFNSISFDRWAFSASAEPVGAGVGGYVSSAIGGSLADALFGLSVLKLMEQNTQAHFQRADYIPAARTGLVLALRDLASSVLGNFGILQEEDQSGRFSKPMIGFLRSLLRERGRKETDSAKIADFLQRSVMAGQIEMSADDPTFTYIPDQGGVRLPMHAVSSMITELTPVLSILRNSYVRCLVIEEPEAHLHLSAQRCMARAIVKLVNLGIPVVVTTHSDTFLQQINLLMQIGGREDKLEIVKSLGYDADDILNPQDVQAYEFLETADGTEVVLAEKQQNGVVIRSLNETLAALVDDIISVSEQ